MHHTGPYDKVWLFLLMPKVCVVMPAYNAARTLCRAIESVRRQTFTDWELRVVDDGSNDQTWAQAEAASSGDERVILQRLPENRGASVAMNFAWRQSRAPYIAILDSDDVALAQRLEKQVAFLDQHAETDVLGTAAHFVDYQFRFLRTSELPTDHEVLSARRWSLCPFVHPSVMMRRTFLEVLGGYKEGMRLGEDSDLWMRGYARGFRYANLSEPLVIYRARTVQKWALIIAGARVRILAGKRESRRIRGYTAAGRIIAEGLIEKTGIFAWRDQSRPRSAPADVRNWFGVPA